MEQIGDDEEGFPGDEPVEMEIEDTLDLHPFAPSEMKSVAEEYLRCAREKGFREVRIIHGKGIGVQREMVRALAERLDWVELVGDGGVTGGGWGSTVLRIDPAEREATKNRNP